MIWVISSALLNVAAGLLLKSISAQQLLPAFTTGNIRVLSCFALALGAYAIAFLGYWMAMAQLPLAIAYLSIVSLTAVGLTAASWTLWGEALSTTQLLGVIAAFGGLVALYKG